MLRVLHTQTESIPLYCCINCFVSYTNTQSDSYFVSLFCSHNCEKYWEQCKIDLIYSSTFKDNLR